MVVTVGLQKVAQQVARIEDRAIDIENDQQRILGVTGADALVMEG